MVPQFTESVAQVFSLSMQEAEARAHVEVTECHVLNAFFQEKEGYFSILCHALNLDFILLVQDLKKSFVLSLAILIREKNLR